MKKCMVIVAISVSMSMCNVHAMIDRFKKAISPSERVSQLKSAMNCVWNNKCSPEQIRAIKYALAAVTAVCLGKKLITALSDRVGEKTVKSIMDSNRVSEDSPAVQLLLDARNYLVGSDDNILNGLMVSIQADDIRLNELRALLELIESIKPAGNRGNNKTLLIGLLKKRIQDPSRYKEEMDPREKEIFDQYSKGPSAKAGN